jgi:hypothetical protein
MYERLLKGDHVGMVAALINLAACLQSLGRSAEALGYAERADAMAARMLPEGHPTRKLLADHLHTIRESLARSTSAAKQ